MHPYHRWFTYFQLFLLLSLTLIFFASKTVYTSVVFYVLLTFFISEIRILEIQRNENPNNRIYRKTCWFGIVDTVSVLGFIYFFVMSAYDLISDSSVVMPYPYILFSYIFIRKLYILKHWTYEK